MATERTDIPWCVIGTAGHIDHGKTSLVRALTGVDTDRLPEEKRRGMTIDLGFAGLDLGEDGAPLRAAVIDVPGHERFIKNMLAGATGMDMVVFCVAADDGVMPQTREHLAIVRLLGIKRCVFAITKCDAASSGRVEQVMADVAALVGNTPLAASPVVPVSSATGFGIGGLKGLIRNAITEAQRPAEAREGFFRFPIDRSFHVKGFGTVVTGTIASGSVRKGDELLCFPIGGKVKVRGIESLHSAIDEAGAGQRAALNISGAPDKDAGRGVMLVGHELAPFVKGALSGIPFLADCSFEFIRPVDLKKGRRQFKAHHLSAESLATIRGTDGGRGRLALKEPLLMLRGDRFILRGTGANETIGAGRVEAAWLRKRQMPRRPLCMDGDAGNAQALSRALAALGGMEISEACLMLNVRKDVLACEIKKDNAMTVLGDYVMDAPALAKAEKRAVEAVSMRHAAHPAEAGATEESVLTAMRVKDAGAARCVLGSLLSRGILKKDGAAIMLPGHCPALKGMDAEIERDIMKRFSPGLSQAGPEDLAILPYKKTDVDRLIGLLVRNGTLVKLREGSYLAAPAVADARARLMERLRTKETIKASEFRDILGCGRKLAIEILEYFDKERVTLRQGDLRRLR
ncbi:MAG: selenocysteine-specific translation elongation factor [Deltaproteobacteria bacterium]|nr:selenocysteine-specific translation elongation factor [Deltaproteobacteria bacterium]